MAQNCVLLVHFFAGLILMVISFIMGLIESTAQANSLLKNFFRLSPGFCFADGLASLALLRQGMNEGSGDSCFDWNFAAASLCYLDAEGVTYFIISLGLEVLLPFNINFAIASNLWMRIRYFITPSSCSEPLLISTTGDNSILDEDIDVRAERDRVLSGGVDSAVIHLRNLRKVYSGEKQLGPKISVHSLTF